MSSRELEVLRQLADGRSTAQMAAAVALSANTVRSHVRTLRGKLAASDRHDLIARARELHRL